MSKCGKKCEIWSRSCGYHRPITSYNAGKREEYKERKPYLAGPAVATIAQTPSRYSDPVAMAV